MVINRFTIKYILVVFLLIVSTAIKAWTPGLVDAIQSLYNGRSTAESRLFIHEHINEINEMALSGDIPDSLYQAAQGDFFDRNYQDLRNAAAQENLDIALKKPEHFTPGTDTDAPLTTNRGSDIDITVKKLEAVEKHYIKNIKEHYKEANLEVPADVADTNTDILVDPDATSEFEACAKHVNDNGGTAYTDPDAVRAEIKIARGEPISFKEASARNSQTKKLAKEKAAQARSYRKKASLLEKTNPNKARRLRAKAQLADSQASKYINRTKQTTNKLRTQHGLQEIPFENVSNLDKAIRNIDTKGRNILTQNDAIVVGNMEELAAEKASQKFIDSLGEIAKARPHTAADVQKAIASELNTMKPTAQAHAIENLESKVGESFAQSVINEAKALEGIRLGQLVKPTTASEAIMQGLTKPIVLGPKGKKLFAYGKATVNITLIAGVAYFMGKDGVYHALKNTTADESYFEFFLDVYKEAAWHGSGLGYAFEEAQAEELEMWKREIERGEPSDSMRKHITITVGKTVVYLGRDIVVGTLTLPYVFLNYLVGFEDAEKKEKYSKAFLAEVRRQIKSRKEFQKALDTANEDGIAFNDQAMYLDCMCSDCGGSLGGFFRPEFQGGGFGPCQCNGPLSIWKAPISSTSEQRAVCKERIRQKNNRITDARMDELHKIAMAENAKSVAKELQKVKQLSQDKDKLIESAILLSSIKELLRQADRKPLVQGLLKKLNQSTQAKISKGKIDDAIKTVEIAKDLTTKGSPEYNNLDIYIPKLNKWKNKWNAIKKVKFPEIYDDLDKHQIISAKKKLQNIDPNLLSAPWTPLGVASSHDPKYLSLKKALAEREKEYLNELNNAKTKAKELMNDREPQAAIDLLSKFLNTWEHNSYTKVPMEKMLSQAKVLLEHAIKTEIAGDEFKKNKNYKAAIIQYKRSLSTRNSSTVERKLAELNKYQVNKPEANKPTDSIKNNENGGYWQLVEEKGSIGRECSPDEVYNDYYRDTVSGFGNHITVTKMVRQGNHVYCKLEGKWQRPPEKLYPKTNINLAVTINRLLDKGQYFCDMEISYDMWDLECGGTGSGGHIGGFKLDRSSPKSLSKTITWEVKEPFYKKPGEKLTIRTCYSASASICGENQGMKYYYKWVEDDSFSQKYQNQHSSTESIKPTKVEHNINSDDTSTKGKGGINKQDTPASVKSGTDSLAISKTIFEPYEELTLSFTAALDYPEKSWIGMFKANLPHDGMEKNNNHELAFHYLMKKTNGTFTFTAPAAEGEYDFRMFNRSKEKEMVTIKFIVKVNEEIASLKIPKKSFQPNEKISVQYTASSLYPEKSWIGMFKANLPHDGMEKNNNHELAFHYLMKKTNGTFTFTAPTAEGEYDFRLFEKSNGKEVATIKFNVRK